MSDKIFAEGIYFDRRETAPDFVVGRLGIDRDRLVKWLEKQQVSDRGYLNLNIAQSRNGKYYVELDTWQPSGDRVTERAAPILDDGLEGVPF